MEMTQCGKEMEHDVCQSILVGPEAMHSMYIKFQAWVETQKPHTLRIFWRGDCVKDMGIAKVTRL